MQGSADQTCTRPSGPWQRGVAQTAPKTRIGHSVHRRVAARCIVIHHAMPRAPALRLQRACEGAKPQGRRSTSHRWSGRIGVPHLEQSTPAATMGARAARARRCCLRCSGSASRRRASRATWWGAGPRGAHEGHRVFGVGCPQLRQGRRIRARIGAAGGRGGGLGGRRSVGSGRTGRRATGRTGLGRARCGVRDRASSPP